MRRHIDRHINQLKQKPEHVRHKVALGASAGVTALVAIIWAVSHAANGTFALTSPEGFVGEEAAAEFANTEGNFSDLLGAVGESFGASSTDDGLTIVDGDSTTTLAPEGNASPNDATSIPF